eukprot:scaffold421365_cov91-Attheya_sp.AAC.1
MTPACNSRLGRYFGMSVDYNTLWRKIKPCDACKHHFDGKYDAQATRIGCDKCTCWDIKPDSPLLAFKPFKDFPIEEIPDSGELPCLALSFPVLVAKYEYAYSKHIKGTWKETKLKEYCSYFGMKPEWQLEIIANVKRKKEIMEIAKDMEKTEEVRKKLIDLDVGFLFDYTTEALDEYYSKPPAHPPTWDSGYSFDEIAPSTMHSLTLNVGKNTIKFVRQMLVILSLEAAFHRYAARVTKSLMNLGLPWLDMLEWEKRGGYVSENWLALLRILKYFCAGASTLTQRYKYVDPTREVKKWNKKEKVAWLKARGVKVGEAMLVKDVNVFFEKEQSLPVSERRPVLMERNFDKSVISKLVSSYYGFTGCVLSKVTVEGETGKECEWRGGVIGEGMLRDVKPLAPRHGSHKFDKMMKHFYRDRALRRLKAEYKTKDERDVSRYKWLADCHVYKTVDDVTLLMEGRSPLCVVRLREKCNKKRGRFLLLVRREDEDCSNDNFPFRALNI